MKGIKKFFADFKKFITKGNIVDLAVAVVVGTAFNKIVSSLVNDIIMPLIGWVLGGKSLSGLVLVLNGEPRYLADGTLNPAALTWNYGNFLQTVIDFLIIAFSIFVVLKIMMKAQELTKQLGEKVKTLSKKQLKKLKKQGLSEQEIEDIKKANEEAVKAEAVAPAPAPKPTTEELLTEILAELKRQNNTEPKEEIKDNEKQV